MKIVFMGTPDFAAGALEAILKAGYEVCCVVTQPDKPKGRGKALQFPAVKTCALRYGLPVFQPVKIKTPEAVEILARYEADLFVVAAFGQILSQEILDMPKYGCVNIHASLLPAYRGAAPIQWAILNGEKETGVTIMQMDAGLDTGDMLTKKAVPIDDTDTGESLHDKLCAAGAELIVETLPLIEQGKLEPQAQDDAGSCYAKMLNKAMGRIDWSRPAAEIERQVRALYSWPGTYTTYHGRNLKVFRARAEALPREADRGEEPGTVVAYDTDLIKVKTGDGLLCLYDVQAEGRKRMPVRDFVLGSRMAPGEKLGE